MTTFQKFWKETENCTPSQLVPLMGNAPVAFKKPYHAAFSRFKDRIVFVVKNNRWYMLGRAFRELVEELQDARWVSRGCRPSEMVQRKYKCTQDSTGIYGASE